MKKTLLIAWFLFSFYCISSAQTWTVYGGMPHIATRCSSVDANMNIWVAMFGGGVSKLTNGTYINYNTGNSGLADNNTTYTAIDNAGNKWFGTFSNGAVKYDGTTWTTYKTSNCAIPGNRINCIAIDASDTKWFGINFCGVTKLTGTVFTTYNTSNSTLPNNNVNAIAIDANNNKWIGSYGGLTKINGSTSAFTNYNTGNSGLANDQVLSIAIEGTTIWVGTGGGLCKFDGNNTWQTYDINNSGLPYNYVSCIAIDHLGNKWVGTTQQGMVKFDGNTTWTPFNTSNSSIPGMDVRSILVDEFDNKWIATADGGFAFYGVNPNTIATLSAITLSAGTLNPSFLRNIYNYSVVMPYSTVNVPTVTPTLTNPAASITSQINATGFTTGNNVTTIVVTAQDGITTATYTVTFTKAPASTNATLSNITLSAGTLNPSFLPGTLNYSVIMPYGTTIVPSATPILSDPNASISNQINATNFTTNNVTSIEVTAENGITVLTYTITFSVIVNLTNYDQDQIRIYPNPFTTSLNIDLGTSHQITKISLIDLLGNKYLDETTINICNENSLIYNLTTIPSGLYLLKIEGDKFVKTYKINKL